MKTRGEKYLKFKYPDGGKVDYTGLGVGFMNNPNTKQIDYDFMSRTQELDPNRQKYIGGSPDLLGLFNIGALSKASKLFTKNVLPNIKEGEYLTRVLKNEEAVKDLLQSGIVKAKEGSKYGGRVFWTKNTDPLLMHGKNTGFRINAKYSPELSNRAVRTDDIISIQKGTANGLVPYSDGGKVDYTGMGIGFMNQPKSDGYQISKQGYSKPISNKQRGDEFINSDEFKNTVLGLSMSGNSPVNIGKVKPSIVSKNNPAPLPLGKVLASQAESLYNMTETAVAEILNMPKRLSPKYQKNVRKAIDEANKWSENWWNNPATKERLNNLSFDREVEVARALRDYEKVGDFNRVKDVLGDDIDTFLRSEDYINGKSIKQGVTDMPNSWQKMMQAIDHKDYLVKTQSKSDKIDRFLSGKPRLHADNYGMSSAYENAPPENFVDKYGPSLKQIKSTITHEGTHGVTNGPYNLPKQPTKILHEAFDLEKANYTSRDMKTGEYANYESYLLNPTEIYARINQLRHHYNINPGEYISTNKMDLMLKDGLSGKTPVDDRFFDLIKSPDKFRKLINTLPAAAAPVALKDMNKNKQKYGGGGLLQAIAPFASFIPGIGPFASAAITAGVSAAGGAIEGMDNRNEQQRLLEQKQQQEAIAAANAGTARSGIAQSKYGYTMSTGGETPTTDVELERDETYLTPDGDSGQVDGPSHNQGGVDMTLPVDSFVWSAKLKSKSPEYNGLSFADASAPLLRMKAKYEKILNS